MNLYAICVLTTCMLISNVHARCMLSDWTQSFKQAGLSKCPFFIRSISISDRNKKAGRVNSDIELIDGVDCCIAPDPWHTSKLQFLHTDWWGFSGVKRSLECPKGFFLTGLKRDGSQPGDLNSIKEGRCTKPADHPRYYNGCYEQDVAACINGSGLCGCNDGYFVAGMDRLECTELRCIHKLKCCKMWDRPLELDGLDAVKERIMDITQSNLALVAHFLGYGWSGGCREQYVGEGFNRVGDSWEADKSKGCQGYKSHHRLKIVYGDWKFQMKDIVFGKQIIEQLIPETVNYGIVINNDSTPVKKFIKVEKSVTRNVTHTAINNWKESQTLGVVFAYQTMSSRAKTFYKFNYETSSTTINVNGTEDSITLESKMTKTFEPFSKKKWKIELSKSRITQPYTATIVVTFFCEFQGFLRWGGGYNGRDTNFHYEFRGSEDRPTFHYRFGDASTPCYKALEQQMRQHSRPWQWYNLNNTYPFLQPLVNDLATESHYEFTLSGQFEDVMGTSVWDEWEALPNRKRETLPNGSPRYQVIKDHLVAKAGAKDPPVHAQFPIVRLDKAKHCDFDDPIEISTLI